MKNRTGKSENANSISGKPHPSANLRAVSYMRVASSNQLDNLEATTKQQALIEHAIALLEKQRNRSIEVIRQIHDSGSGLTAQPGLEEIMSMIKQGCIDLLVTSSPDRISRNSQTLRKFIQTAVSNNCSVLTYASGEPILSNKAPFDEAPVDQSIPSRKDATFKGNK